jgi:hypothetical protein
MEDGEHTQAGRGTHHCIRYGIRDYTRVGMRAHTEITAREGWVTRRAIAACGEQGHAADFPHPPDAGTG